MKRKIKSLCLAVCFGLAALSAAAQGVVWNGPTVNFTNVAGSDPFQPASQDRLTGDVWLTRAATKGLFNAAVESGFTSFVSPAGTAWAYGTLANYASLTYTDWETWNGKNPPSMVGQDAVVHLLNSDIYLSIKFTFWGGSGGGFSYARSSPAVVPEPSTGGLMLAGLLAVVAFGKKSRLRRDR